MAEINPNKPILKLKLPTDPRWVNIAEKNIEDILVDHAYCEQKAATSGISLIVKYPDKTKLVEEMTALVAEEWSHFERVMEELKKRGFGLGRNRPDEYVVELSKHIRKGDKRERQLMDHLLVNALIEARSCERFKLLWKNIQDEGLQKFYYELMVSEAGHFVSFVKLAKEYMPADVVDARLQELLKIEAEIIASLEHRPDRMH
ncbi:tRNA 2-methylthio-N6-isopentenyl adenosine(37) hydroxylase MiaE [Adhaeribacter aerolatus]|uniref:tRNA 2-methylthio-N6-isopentenyl adenosine(37) hydroxylase MiaE n=1 Tax=Adhaeribacter aerolatus TaxID=670289 RepID=A0A512AZ24_9BACT|nr:tRNA-(ms[2]io[6]A)-hydroxylase [Adhaeribacter aerolatus]GEO04971.1 tRNA 2-methylthio-N6-isopentenyl adenosine(37) hydroxylase MiaE [Adhaeribacter aerolatus]